MMGFLKKLVAFLVLTMPLSMVRGQAVSVDVLNNCPFDVSLNRIGYANAELFDCERTLDSLILAPGEYTTITPNDTADSFGTMYTAVGIDNSQILWDDGEVHTQIMMPPNGATDTNCDGQSFFDISQTSGKLFFCSTDAPVIEAPYPDPVTTTFINNCESDVAVAGLYYDYTDGAYSFKCDSIHDSVVIPTLSYATVVSGKYGSMYTVGDGYALDNSGILTNNGSVYEHIMPADGATTDETCDGVTHVDIAPARDGVLFLCSTEPTHITTTRKLHRKFI